MESIESGVSISNSPTVPVSSVAASGFKHNHRRWFKMMNTLFLGFDLVPPAIGRSRRNRADSEGENGLWRISIEWRGMIWFWHVFCTLSFNFSLVFAPFFSHRAPPYVRYEPNVWANQPCVGVLSNQHLLSVPVVLSSYTFKTQAQASASINAKSTLTRVAKVISYKKRFAN